MNLILLKTTFKKNWILMLIFIGVLVMYLAVMVAMFDPEDMNALNEMISIFPEELMKAFGFSSLVTDLTAYLASWLYGMLMTALPVVYCIILGNRLVAKMVDNGSLAYLLSTPVSRVKIILTQGLYAILSVISMFGILTLFGVLICEISFSGHLDVRAFVQLNITTALVNILAIMIAFFISCLFNESGLSSGSSSGVLIGFLLMNMIGGSSEQLEILKKLSIYGMYDPVEIVRGAQTIWLNTGLCLVSLILLVVSVLVFKRKQLPI
jgi:ABC-2 type transport system permease protein